MKSKILSLLVIGLSALSVLGSTGCIGTVTTYNSNGVIRVEDRSTGEVRLNRGQFCVIVKQNGEPVVDKSIDLELTYKVVNRTRRATRALRLDDEGIACFTVQFSHPVSGDDIRLRRASLRVFPESTRRFGKLSRVEVSEDRTEGRVWMEFNMEDTRESALDPVGELSYVLRSATGRLSLSNPSSRGTRVAEGERNVHLERIASGPASGSRSTGAL